MISGQPAPTLQRLRFAVAAAMFGAAALLASCTSSHTAVHDTSPLRPASTSTTAGPTSNAPSASTAAAPCSSLTAAGALSMVGESGLTLDQAHPFACSGTWAYVNYVHPQPHANHATKDLQYVDGRWVIADRGIACGNSTSTPAMPPSLAEWGCGN